MCHNSLSTNTLDALLLDQPPKSVERATSFEGTYALLVLTLEEYPDFELRCTIRLLLANGLPFISFCLCGACDSIYGFACRDGRAVDVRLDASVSYLYRLSCERRTGLVVGHGVCGQ